MRYIRYVEISLLQLRQQSYRKKGEAVTQFCWLNSYMKIARFMITDAHKFLSRNLLCFVDPHTVLLFSSIYVFWCITSASDK